MIKFNKKESANHYRLIQKNEGATLIESVIALFVFAIGALGLAALQVNSYLYNDDSNQRTIVTLKAQEIIDRIVGSRSFSDPNGFAEEYVAAINSVTVDGVIGNYDNTPFSTRFCEDSAPDFSCVTQSCEPNDLALKDIYEVLCDSNLGASTAAADAQGSAGVSGLDLVLKPENGCSSNCSYELYIEWLARGSQDAEARLVASNQTQLCGTQVTLDSRVNALCFRFR